MNVIVADDHAIVRTGLKLLLSNETSISFIAEASSGQELLTKLKQQNFDLVILDISMPGKDSIDTLKEIKSCFPKLPVIIFTMNKEESYCLRMFKNGATAYINKEANPETLIAAIKKVVKGKKFYTDDQIELLTQHFTDEDKKPHEKLSDREFQIMCLLASGVSKTEISASLCVSKNTISNHRNNILKKMSLESNSDITRYALKNGLIV